MLDRELSVKGWNWGTANFAGNSLAFEVNKNDAFEIPLASVQQCTPGKNEVALEFHAVSCKKMLALLFVLECFVILWPNCTLKITLFVYF